MLQNKNTNNPPSGDGGINAIIIDDERHSCDALKMLLDKCCKEVQVIAVCNSAEEAIKKINELNPQLIFLDIEMPQIDGYTVLEHLRADARFAGIPIVAYTVHVSEMNAAYQRGFNGFLGKPLDTDRFPDQLARILGGQPVWETF